MSSGLKVGVKYCGHCNPRLNGPEIIRAVQERAKEISFTSWDDPQKAILLIIGACPSDCASRPPFDGPVITLSNISLQGNAELINSKAGEQILTNLQAVHAELKNT